MIVAVATFLKVCQIVRWQSDEEFYLARQGTHYLPQALRQGSILRECGTQAEQCPCERQSVTAGGCLLQAYPGALEGCGITPRSQNEDELAHFLDCGLVSSVPFGKQSEHVDQG